MRIVSLCPSITETLIDFGLAEDLVGVTRFCIRPREVTRRLPKVGGTKDPDIEAIRRARPDLIFVNEEENTKAAFDTLSAEFNVDASFPKRIREVPALLRRFGRATQRIDVAEARARSLESALAALRPERAFRFAYLIWRDPWMSVNADTYVADLFGEVGGENVFGKAADRYPTIALEDLVQEAPELVILPDEPFKFRPRDRAEILEHLPKAQVELVSGDDCCWHGVRSIEGLALVKRLSVARLNGP